MLRVLVPVLLAVLLAPALADRPPEVGDLAPDFELLASDGNSYRLSDFRGREAVVLAWFPRAFTSGCTLECRSLARNGHLLEPFEVSYFMASVDPLEENQAFAEALQADFPLLSDEDRKVADAYGVLNPAGMANRWTFYIDRDGRIMHIDREIEPEHAAENMARQLKALNVPRREPERY